MLAPLGEGGMAVVYRARDTRLARDVAIRVLPDVHADDPDRLTRFIREAQIEQYAVNKDATRFLVLELPAGAQGPLVQVVTKWESAVDRSARR
jgi:serine/threonine protein kinase